MNTDLQALMDQALKAWNELPEEERIKREREAKRRWICAEMAIGDDDDEEAYRIALLSGDTEAIVRLEAEAAERMRRANEMMDRLDI